MVTGPRDARLRLPPPPPVARAVAATPPDRDRVLDLLRATALVVVVLGHASMGIVGWHGDVPVVSNALAVYPWAPWATWIAQVMPLFFVAGGAVNARSWRSTPLSYPAWLWRRVARLLRPVWVYLAIMAPTAALFSRWAPPGFAVPLLTLATQLLWFVGVYVMVCALTPVLVALHRRGPAVGPVLLLGAAALVDVGRLLAGAPAALGLLNFVLVWALAAQLGLVLDDGLLRGWRGAALAGAALAANLVLVAVGPWPRSMVGLPGEPFTNMAPPSLVLALHATVLAGAAGAARPALVRAAAGRRTWTAVTAVNLTAMTLYLWHLPVLVLVVATSHAAGLDRPVTWQGEQPLPGPGYWPWTLALLAAFLLGVAGAVRVMWPFELGTLGWWDRPARRGPTGPAPVLLAAAGCVAVGVGTLMLSAAGLSGFPTRVVVASGVPVNSALAIALMAAGGLSVRHAGSTHTGSSNGKRALPL